MELKGTPQTLLHTYLSPKGHLLHPGHLAGPAPPEFPSLMMPLAARELNFPEPDLPNQAQCLQSWREDLRPLRLRQEEEDASGGGVGECAFGRHTKGSEGGNTSSSWIRRTSSSTTSGKPSRGNATLEATPETEADPGPAFTELPDAEETPAAFQQLCQLL